MIANLQSTIKILFFYLFMAGASINAHSMIQEHDPKMMSNIAFYNLSGKKLSIEQLEGNVLILHFWATWCPSCTKEMESLNQLQKIVKKEPIIVVPISEDFKGSGVVEDFYHVHNLRNLTAFIDPSNKLFRELKLSSLPATFIIDASGRNVAVVKEPIDWTNERVVKTLRKYIAQKLTDNQDYTALLHSQKLFDDDNALKTEKEPIVPASAETQLAPKKTEEENNAETVGVDISNNGVSFRVRRPVNPSISKGNEKNDQ